MTNLNLDYISSVYTDDSKQTSSKKIWEAEITIGQLIKPQDRQQFYHLLSTLLASGLGIIDCMIIIMDQSPRKAFKEILDKIKNGLEEGNSLSECMKTESRHFSSFETHSIQMGEQTGEMIKILAHLAILFDKQIQLKRKTVQALSYPIAVIIIASLVLTFMIAFVVPMFEDIFKRFDSELPPITQFILEISTLFQSYGFLILTGIMAVIGLLISLKKNRIFRKLSSKILLKIPLIGKLFLKLQLSRFCYTFSLLLKAKVNMDKSLSLLHKITSFYPIQQSIDSIQQDVIRGSTLYQAMTKHPIFPPYLTQIIKVGEKTAQLDRMLENMAKNLDAESEAGIGQITQFLEPVLIVVLGGMVAVILVSMYLPMFELSNAIG